MLETVRGAVRRLYKSRIAPFNVIIISSIRDLRKGRERGIEGEKKKKKLRSKARTYRVEEKEVCLLTSQQPGKIPAQAGFEVRVCRSRDGRLNH